MWCRPWAPHYRSRNHRWGVEGSYLAKLRQAQPATPPHYCRAAHLLKVRGSHLAQLAAAPRQARHLELLDLIHRGLGYPTPMHETAPTPPTPPVLVRETTLESL